MSSASSAKPVKSLFLIIFFTLLASYIALPNSWHWQARLLGRDFNLNWHKPQLDFYLFGQHIHPDYQLKKGLDIQGGMQVVLRADMTDVGPEDRDTALTSAKDIISRRIDLYGVSEPTIQTARLENDYRLIVELPGIDDPQQALDLIGQTAQLEFKLQGQLPESATDEASQSALLWLSSFTETGLTGQQLKRAQVQFNQQTGQAEIALQFDDAGRELFADITKNHVGGVLAIFIDGMPIVTPTINSAILDGQAVMTGNYTVDEAKNLAIQLNAGALPVGIEVLEQKTIGASLGETSVQQSVKAGLIGLLLVMLFMILYYGWEGVISCLALIIYAVFSVALYKVLGVVLTLPGIAGLILTIGMAVDSNILIFARIKEELRAGHPYPQAMQLGFGRAWDSIKDANLASILTALILINPLNFSFLNSSGLVKGFGLTFLLGSIVSLLTGVVISKVLMQNLMPVFKAKEFHQ